MKVLRRRISAFYGRFSAVFLISAGVLMALAALMLFDSTKPAPQRLTQRDIDAAVSRALASATPAPPFSTRAYEVIRPSLVSVAVQVPGPDGKPERSLGSGVVIDDTGTILTSLHVVADADEVRVMFADGTESSARTIVRQPENDLAVLKPQTVPDDLVPATLASGGLSVGDDVVAVGNPFGIRGSLTSGVVSGLGREFKSPETGETLHDLIQFDAAVNPGNSGGPLLDRNGEVVGIVTGLLNPTDQNVFVGIGFAVPIETAAGALGSPPY